MWLILFTCFIQSSVITVSNNVHHVFYAYCKSHMYNTFMYVNCACVLLLFFSSRIDVVVAFAGVVTLRSPYLLHPKINFRISFARNDVILSFAKGATPIKLITRGAVICSFLDTSLTTLQVKLLSPVQERISVNILSIDK